jgi:hypothetical protein
MGFYAAKTRAASALTAARLTMPIGSKSPPRRSPGMGISSRHYLFADDGLYRLSHRMRSGLARGRDALPQYAGTRQKVASVIVQNENGKPTRILEASGSYYANGKVDVEVVRHAVRK